MSPAETDSGRSGNVQVFCPFPVLDRRLCWEKQKAETVKNLPGISFNFLPGDCSRITLVVFQACYAVIQVMRQEIEHEWDSRAGDTILVEKRKKKTKVSYVDSELAVQEALDRVCDEHRYSKFNATTVYGVKQYAETPHNIGNKDHMKYLSSTCQKLMADFEHEIVRFFHTKKGTSEIRAAERAICTDIAKMCRVKDSDQLQATALAANALARNLASSEPSDSDLLEAASKLQRSITDL